MALKHKFKSFKEVRNFCDDLIQQKFIYKGQKVKNLNLWFIIFTGDNERAETHHHRMVKISECYPKYKVLKFNKRLLQLNMHDRDKTEKIIKCAIARAIQYELFGCVKSQKKYLKIVKALNGSKLIKRVKSSKKDAILIK